MTELDRLEALEREATKGPWESTGYGLVEAEELEVAYHVSPDNAAFIAALRNAAPALIAVARAAEECFGLDKFHPEQRRKLKVALARLNAEAPDA